MTVEDMTVEDIAKICYAVNKGYSELINDKPLFWELCRDSVISGVQYVLERPNITAKESHDDWIRIKLNDGWKFGTIKDADKKEHPCLVSWDDLPQNQRIKDILFIATIRSLEQFLIN